jgi:hypothetical protein
MTVTLGLRALLAVPALAAVLATTATRWTEPAPAAAAGCEITVEPSGRAVAGEHVPVPAGSTRFVSPRGVDTASGSELAPWRTVDVAVTNAPSGSTIVLRGGAFDEPWSVPSWKRLRFQSYPGEEVRLLGSTMAC